jgi:tetratricopeptide (TPR) repeat protein
MQSRAARMRTLHVAVYLGLATVTQVGCAQQSNADRAQANFATFRREHDKQKLLDRGKMFAAVGDNTRAEQYFAAAIESGADESQVFPLLLTACLNDNRFRLAAQYAEDHLRRHPADVRARLVLGTIYSAIGDSNGAQKELRQVLTENPNEPQAHYALAVSLRDGRGDAEEIDMHLREYLRLAPNGPYAGSVKESLIRPKP